MTCSHPQQRVLTFWTDYGAIKRVLFVCTNPQCGKRRYHTGRYWFTPTRAS